MEINFSMAHHQEKTLQSFKEDWEDESANCIITIIKCITDLGQETNQVYQTKSNFRPKIGHYKAGTYINDD